MKNLFSNIPDDLSNELLETLVDTDIVRIERIISHGHASPEGFWYDQEQHEWVAVLKGAARLRFEADDKLLEMGPYMETIMELDTPPTTNPMILARKVRMGITTSLG